MEKESDSDCPLEQWPIPHNPPKLHDGKRKEVGNKPWVKRCHMGLSPLFIYRWWVCSRDDLLVNMMKEEKYSRERNEVLVSRCNGSCC